MGAVRGLPKVHERLPLQLATEYGADPRAGEPERVIDLAVERENEAVAQHAADGAGFNIAALGRQAIAAPFIPIGKQFTGRWIFHIKHPCLKSARAMLVVSLFGTPFDVLRRDEAKGSRWRAAVRSRLARG